MTAPVKEPIERAQGRGGLWEAILLGVAVLSGVAYMSGAASGQAPHIAAKTLPVLCLAVWCWRGNRLVAAGLVASGLGDAFLDAPGAWFLPGMAAFLTAHLFYIAAFVGAERRPCPLHAIPFLAWAGGAFAAVRANLGGMAAPVAAYMTVICAMMWRAAAQAGSRRLAWLGFVGAVMFGASDTLIALAKWAKGVPYSGLAVMLLYWGGQALIAAWARTAKRA